MEIPTPHTITMTDVSIIRLMTWLSPAFPIGGFAWSNGLETACQNGSIKSATDLRNWITTGLEQGAARNDAILLAAAHKGSVPIAEVNKFALALAGSAERYQETTELGRSFLKAADFWTSAPTDWASDEIAYPVSIGWVSAHNEIQLEDTLRAFLQSVVSNQVQAALRLIKLGQRAGVELLASLESTILEQARVVERSTLDDIGSSSLMMDIASMNHEPLHSRIFRS